MISSPESVGGRIAAATDNIYLMMQTIRCHGTQHFSAQGRTVSCILVLQTKGTYPHHAHATSADCLLIGVISLKKALDAHPVLEQACPFPAFTMRLNSKHAHTHTHLKDAIGQGRLPVPSFLLRCPQSV